MLEFLQATTLLTHQGFERGLNWVKHLIFSTHNDSLLQCFKDKDYVGNDATFQLQLLHLVARKSYIGLVEYIMAAHAARTVSDVEHLLAMDPRCDYRGHTATTRAFNDDAYLVRKLFHGRDPGEAIWAHFVGDAKLRPRAQAYNRLKRLKIYADLVHKLNPGKRRRADLDSSAVMDVIHNAEPNSSPMATRTLALMCRLTSEQIRNHHNTIVRAVAVTDCPAVLDIALNKFKAAHGSRRCEVELMKFFLLGPIMYDGGAMPDETLRAICKWG